MLVTRRDLLKAGTVVLSSALAERAFPSTLRRLFVHECGSYSGLIPILQTFTNATSAQFQILLPSDQSLSYQVLTKPMATQQPSVKVLSHFVHPNWQESAIEHVLVEGLAGGNTYHLQIIDTASGVVKDEREFQSFDLHASTSRIAVISCMCDDFPEVQQNMWQGVAQQNPDVVFLVGDATYLDGRNSDDQGGMWRRHLEVRRALDLYRWPRLKPVVSVWDDHDFGINDGGADYPLKAATRQMFEAMFGSVAQSGLVRGPSLALELRFSGQRFYLMDDRFYRTRGVTHGSHWGDEQEEWLFSQLQSSAEPAFLMNGSQYFGGYSGFESFEKEHPDQFLRVQQRLSKINAPIAFVSGDRHFSEVMAIESKVLGYETLEVTSSSLHSYKPDSVPTRLNSRRQKATANYNFMMIESSGQVSPHAPWDLKIAAIGPNSQVLFTHEKSIVR